MSEWHDFEKDKPKNGKYIGLFDDVGSLDNEYFHTGKYMDFYYIDGKVYPNDYSDSKLLIWMEIPR